MNNDEILNFRNQIQNFTIDELTNVHTDLHEKMSKMILESDIVIKIAIVESLLNEKLEKEQSDGKANNGKN